MKQDIAPFPSAELGDLGRGFESLPMPFTQIDHILAEEAIHSLGRNDIDYSEPYLSAYSMNACRLLIRCNDSEDLFLFIDAANFFIYYKQILTGSMSENDLMHSTTDGCKRIEGSCMEGVMRRTLARLERESPFRMPT